ncbi:unnamed protein product [Caenorhabditis brenneri]
MDRGFCEQALLKEMEEEGPDVRMSRSPGIRWSVYLVIFNGIWDALTLCFIKSWSTLFKQAGRNEKLDEKMYETPHTA